MQCLIKIVTVHVRGVPMQEHNSAPILIGFVGLIYNIRIVMMMGPNKNLSNLNCNELKEYRRMPQKMRFTYI